MLKAFFEPTDLLHKREDFCPKTQKVSSEFLRSTQKLKKIFLMVCTAEDSVKLNFSQRELKLPRQDLAQLNDQARTNLAFQI
jgi:hypothetical protein